MNIHMQARIARCWRMLRQLSTDDAYEQYLRHHASSQCASSPRDRPPLDRRAYYLRAQEHKWNGIQRCC